MEENTNIITLTDEDGNEVEFELLSTVNHNDTLYAMMVPALEEGTEEEEEEMEPLILKIGSALNKDVDEAFEAVTPENSEYDVIFDELMAEYESAFAGADVEVEEEDGEEEE